jgi:phenylpropionate dioxygenase-like ring-hydroxylating dioxygenase large terminal subunit
MSIKEMMNVLTAPADPTLKKGEARCPGPSTQDLLRSEPSNVRDPALLIASDAFLGDEDLPFSRYTSQTFYERELTLLWPKVWQWACREEHIPHPGDFYTYDIGPYSALVIRGDDGEIRAFVNACPHRGMAFTDAGSQGSGKQFIRCPFHGMSWHLDGSLKEVPCRWDFPHIEDTEFGLDEIPCEGWAGFVFINFDRHCGPLSEYLGVLPEHFKDWGLEDRFVAVHTQKVLPGNWKMCLEGFLEAFHVLATHPEVIHTASWANTQYDLFGPTVTRFLQTVATGNPNIEQSQQEIYRLLGYQDELPEGVSAREQHAAIQRAKLGQQWGTDLSEVSTSLMLDSIEYHLFPNACFFPGIQIPLIYRFRPIGLDACLHEIMMLQPVPDHEPRPLPAQPIQLGLEDSYTSVPDFPLAKVLDQDTENFHRQWAGMKASLKKGQTLANYQEARIRSFHRTLDGYITRA